MFYYNNCCKHENNYNKSENNYDYGFNNQSDYEYSNFNKCCKHEHFNCCAERNEDRCHHNNWQDNCNKKQERKERCCNHSLFLNFRCCK